jgi:hypothetical protein
MTSMREGTWRELSGGRTLHVFVGLPLSLFALFGGIASLSAGWLPGLLFLLVGGCWALLIAVAQPVSFSPDGVRINRDVIPWRDVERLTIWKNRTTFASIRTRRGRSWLMMSVTTWDRSVASFVEEWQMEDPSVVWVERTFKDVIAPHAAFQSAE